MKPAKDIIIEPLIDNRPIEPFNGQNMNINVGKGLYSPEKDERITNNEEERKVTNNGDEDKDDKPGKKTELPDEKPAVDPGDPAIDPGEKDRSRKKIHGSPGNGNDA